MTEFLLVLFIFGLSFTLLAVGAIIRGKPLKGSCGGLNQFLGKTSCVFCKKKAEDCPNKRQSQSL